MTGSEATIRAFRTGDEDAVNRTFNEVFRTSRSLEEWSWKFPPVSGGRPIMLSLCDDQVLTHYAGIPLRFHADGKVWPAAQIVDVYSSRAARRQLGRRGLWVRTVDAFFEQFGASGAYPLLLGFPGRRALRLGVLQLGYDAVRPQPIRYLCREHRTMRRRARTLIYRAEPARDWEPRLDNLWQRIVRDYPVAVVRDSERALQRLAGHPTVRYHRFLVFPRLSAEPVAFAAFRSDGGRVRWVEVLWDHAHPGALELLSRLSARLAVEGNAEVEELWLNGDPAGVARLEASGFEQRPEPDGLVMVARSFEPLLDVQTFNERVYLTMADADLV